MIGDERATAEYTLRLVLVGKGARWQSAVTGDTPEPRPGCHAWCIPHLQESKVTTMVPNNPMRPLENYFADA